MRAIHWSACAVGILVSHGSAATLPSTLEGRRFEADRAVKPKVVIVSQFAPEANVWYGIPECDVLERNVSVPGLSPLFPDVHCTLDGEVCQVTIGEGEINAAISVQSLAFSPLFDLSTTYFLIAGIAGVNPEIATICSVTFARYAVQVALQYEISQFELPTNFSSGYVPQGSKYNDQYPQLLYGTEVFEFNQDLQHLAAELARTATLKDSALAAAYRANYASSDRYAAGAALPGVYECDVATSDTYFSGAILSEAFSNFTRLVTNGSGIYCTTQQEDNATAEALLRAALAKLVDFSRVIVMRTASDFDRPYPGQAATTNLLWAEQGAFGPSFLNLYLAGIKIVRGILDEWDSKFEEGIAASNYVGDIFGTLGGEPDFGPYIGSNSPTKRGARGNVAGNRWQVML